MPIFNKKVIDIYKVKYIINLNYQFIIIIPITQTCILRYILKFAVRNIKNKNNIQILFIFK